MTKEELAAKLTGRQVGQEITKAEEAEAKKSALVVIFGYSDDNCELRGAINDEVGVCDGGTVLIDSNGGLLAEIDHDDIEVLKKHDVLETVQARHKLAVKIEALWCDPGEPEYSWSYRTDVPHATFKIMENGEPYCLGIAINLKELVTKPATHDGAYDWDGIYDEWEEAPDAGN
ncbi:MAG: hypothetical protein V1790_17415 [Planctomycetota bacterium]